MSQLKLVPEPTFSAPVSIPRPGEEPAVVRFTFRHRTRKEIGEFLKDVKGRKDVDNIMDMVTGWELTDEFSRKNVERLLQGYHASAQVITETYLTELAGHRLKN